MKYLIIMTSLLGMADLPASEIRWSARGTVSALSGTALAGTGVASGNPVEITMAYDSNTQVNGRSYLPIGGAIAGRAWFYGDVKLRITVKIANNTWTGEMAAIPSSANVMESVCWDLGGNPDTFNVTLDAARGGTFPEFPHTGNESVRALKLEFRDDSSPAELFDVHVLPDSVTHVCAMTSATGAIQAGSSTIAFAIDPASVHITRPRVPVSISKTSTGIRISWETELGKSYRIEGSSNLRCWSDEGIHSGNGTPRQQDFTPLATEPKRFYRIAEL